MLHIGILAFFAGILAVWGKDDASKSADKTSKNTGSCTSTFEGGKGCWVDPYGNGDWALCEANDADACEEKCNSPEDVASQCEAYSGGGDKDGADDWDKGDGTEWDKKTTSKCDSGNQRLFTHRWNGAEKTREYSLVEPKDSPQGLVVVLQAGGGSCGDLACLAQNISVLVACPSVIGNGWKAFHSAGDSEDVEFIAALIQDITLRYGAPASKVIVTGFSAGGSMAYRLSCERSDVIGGLVPYGQTFLEPFSGHIKKGEETPGMTTTEQVLQMMEAARQSPDKCDPEFKRPHYALVGTQDNYYGEVAGAYKGKALWEHYSTTVLGCTGNPTEGNPQEAATLTGQAVAACYHYASCTGLAPNLNRYCMPEDMYHETKGWDSFVEKAFVDFFVEKDSPTVSANGAANAARATGLVAISVAVFTAL